MTSLTQFTLDDRVNLQRILNLPITEIEGNSDLYGRLCEAEDRDHYLGSNIVQRIKDNLAELIDLLEAIALAQTKANYGANEIEEDINSEYKYKVKFNGNASIDAGSKARQKYLIKEIKRDLNYFEQFAHRICLG